MNFIGTFVRRPVATTLLTVAIALAGAMAYRLLPVSPLPQVDFPTIFVTAKVPGASAETMAATVATPLERALGRIAGVTELTSMSSLGSSNVILQFDLSRDINGAARDVQAAINAARDLLPTSLVTNPTYRKVNPSESPVMILALTSTKMPRGQIYDAASSILAQKILQIQGVGDVNVGGGALPAVRIELDPAKLNARGLSLASVSSALATTDVNKAKGLVEQGDRRWQIEANDQALTSKDYLPLIVSYADGAAIKLGDLGDITDSVEDIHNGAVFSNPGAVQSGALVPPPEPAILLIITRQPGANIIATVDRIKAMLPVLQASIPEGIKISAAADRSKTIRASLWDVERTLTLAVILVVLVVFVFLRDGPATLIPAVAVPVSLIGTLAVMYLAGFSLNNLSLMALTIATGFVVDDAIVVLENVSRHLESGMSRFEAALQGAREVGFTVISMSLSLVAVFIPILLMGGVVGRLFREFAITLSVAIMVSLVVSLTTTPMMCARVLRRVHTPHPPGGWKDLTGRLFDWLLAGYSRTLRWALGHRSFMVLLLAATVGLNVYLYAIIPKGFFPQQDTGMLQGMVQTDQSMSFQAKNAKVNRLAEIVSQDPAVDTVSASTGAGGGRGSGSFMYVQLKPISLRDASADAVINRLRTKTASVTGAQLLLTAGQDIQIGGRSAAAQYQYTIQSDSIDELRAWEPRIRQALAGVPELADVNTDSQDKGRQTSLVIDRDKLSRLGLTIAQVDNVLYNAFGQRQVSTLYEPLNQYHVVMELAQPFDQNPSSLNDIYVISPTHAKVPLAAFSHYQPSNTALAVNHQGQFVATTVSFNLPPGISLSDASGAIARAMVALGTPNTIQGSFQGTAKIFQDSLNSEPLLILAALIAVYLVLGILYESLIHPITILSTLPSAGVGALLALMLCHTEFTLISLIGVLLLIGIVKKNAIMMVDFALEAERSGHLSAPDAIFRACQLRFRPILMTTLAALLGALPLAIGFGEGSEMRRPLGIAIVGGLVFSQALTLYTTPVVYLYFDRLQSLLASRHRRPAPLPPPSSLRPLPSDF